MRTLDYTLDWKTECIWQPKIQHESPTAPDNPNPEMKRGLSMAVERCDEAWIEWGAVERCDEVLFDCLNALTVKSKTLKSAQKCTPMFAQFINE